MDYCSREFLILWNQKSPICHCFIPTTCFYTLSLYQGTPCMMISRWKPWASVTLKKYSSDVHVFPTQVCTFGIYNICLPPAKVKHNSGNGNNTQNRIEYTLHSVLFGLKFLNIFIPILNCLTCVCNSVFKLERHKSEFEWLTWCFLSLNTRFHHQHWNFETDLTINKCANKIAPVWCLSCSIEHNFFLIHVSEEQ